MITMKYKSSAAAVAIRTIPVTDAPSRTRTTPVKPMGVSTTLHAPAKPNTAAQQAARNARRDRVVLEHLPLVKAIAVRVHENLPVHVDLDDLVHAGILGLFDAASKFNPDKQVVFSSYAKHRIKGAILDSLRQLDWASRDMRRRHKQVEAATRDLASSTAARTDRSRSCPKTRHGRRTVADDDARSAERRPGFRVHPFE